MTNFLTLTEMDLAGKTVLVRADLNVPMQEERVSDATRLTRFIPTLRALQNAGAKIVVLSHFGRPQGQRNEKYSLRPIAAALSDLLHEPVAFAKDCIGPLAQEALDKLQVGQVLLLENTRFYAEEEANNLAFAQKLAALGDVYINDAFSAAHRAHASTTALASLLPAAAGLLMQEELAALSKALDHPEKPVAALIGGSKISTKLDLLQNIIRKVDLLVLGGGMANTFLAAQNINIGKSLYEADMLQTAKNISDEAAARGCRLLLPIDVVIATEMKENVDTKTVSVKNVPADSMIFDIGPASITEIKTSLNACRTLIWNGPLGVFEISPFNKGTDEIAHHVAILTKENKLLSVAGGGDTVAALSQAGVTTDISYLSTAGGAFLEWLEGKTLPGVLALRKK